jgi:FMN-dependent oxidoreductase (nitrilotriacetate monooxygenase family)
MTREIRLNALDQCNPSFLAFGLWRHPRDKALDFTSIDYWADYARLLERGLFDALFLADSLGVPDTYRQSYAPAFRSGALAPSLDPSVIVPAMALVTENLGFAITGSASYETPYLFARRMTTLDHMTRGRIGWNIVTSFLRSGALAMGHNELAEHDARYDAADEFMAVMYGLWEGSWADGALKRDKTSGIYADPELITELDHSGGHHRIRAVSAAEPSLQRTPMLFQAGGSPRGRHFAATHAEGIFINGPQLELVAPQVADMRKRAAALGRDPRSLKFFAGATIIVDETEALARARYEDYKRHTSVEGMLCQLSAALGIDLSKYPLDEPIRYEKTDAAHSQLDMLTRKGSWTVRQAVESMVVSGRNLLIVGTPEQVVDEFARWVEHADVDGFNIARVLAHETMENFIDMVVPELQRRGMFKTEYAAGTLRERVTGSGPRTAPDHPASRYRG